MQFLKFIENRSFNLKEYFFRHSTQENVNSYFEQKMFRAYRHFKFCDVDSS